MNNLTPKNERFIINKIGLVNFWLYDEETFDFYDGRLILRGSNGSGKSVTMQSFIPLILDGNKSPERLDPFGGKDRKIEDYLIGEADSIQKEESTGYLYMELFKKENNQYITIGMGLRARKGKGTDFWGFAIKNNKRIGKDFYLYKDKNNKVPLTKLELKSRLGIENEFVETAKEYKSMVNRLLFGFDNLDTYDEFIKLLLQLRSNKLSKEFKPTTLTKILNTVLQPLSEEELRPISDSIEEMDKTTEILNKLEKDLKLLNELLKIYNNYNETILFSRSESYLTNYNEEKSLQKLVNNYENSIKEMKQSLENKSEEITKLDNELEVTKAKKRQLDDSNLTNKVEELNELQVKFNDNKSKIEEIDKTLEEIKDKLLTNQNLLNQNENAINKLEKEIKELSSDIDIEVPTTYFNEVSLFTENLLENINTPISFVPIFSTLKKHIDKVSEIKIKLDEKVKIIDGLNDKIMDYEAIKNEYNKLENSLNNIASILKESILNWEEEFINIEVNNQIFKINDETKKEIFTLMNNYNKKNYTLVLEQLNNVYNKYMAKSKEEFYHLESKLELQLQKISELEHQILNLKRQDDLDITYDDEELELNNYLDENNISFIPFYKLIEFKENIDDKVKNYIEAMLLDTKIIGAKVIEEKHKNDVLNISKKGMFLFPSKKKKNNLSNYLMPCENNLFEKEYILSILESISLDENDLFYLGEENYHIDFIYGTISNKYEQKYIGLLKRLDEKRKRLETLNKELNEQIKIKDNIEGLIQSNKTKENILYTEYMNIPNNDKIENILIEKEDIIKNLDWYNQKEKILESIISKFNEQIANIDKDIEILSKGLNIPLNTLKYGEVIKSLNKINTLLNSLDKAHNTYTSKLENKISLSNIIDEIEFNRNNLMEEINELKNDNYKSQKKIDIINELLNKKEYQNILETLVNIEKRLAEIPNEKQNMIIVKTKLESEINHLDVTIKEKEIELENIKNRVEVYAYIFKREYNLKYVFKEDIGDVYDTAILVNKNLINRKNVSISNIIDSFAQAYHSYKLQLNDYNLVENNLFITDDNMQKLFPNVIENDLNIILDNAVRKNMTAIFDGKRMNIFELVSKIESAILYHKDLISEQDRHLFEDILLNTVGMKIKERINSSNDWVLRINNIMKEMQQFSSLGLRLRWTGKEALTEEEIDTKKIVELLEMPHDMIKESDANLLTNHFRAKIKKAFQMNEGNYTSCYNIIAEVLDYRNWFEFQMFYQRSNEEKRELTDRAYSKFSGGERAKATYIPLFASVFAKYYSAKKDAPRIIALDEAFAGVDEVNIREMFGILTSLDLDFIINSQTLWGDYDTIPLMSICELIKPVGSKVVSVERYRWNGKNKEIVIEDNEDGLCELFQE